MSRSQYAVAPANAALPDLNVTIVGVARQEETFIPTADDQLLEGDEVYVVVDSAHVQRTLSIFGHEEPEARRIVIFGGGNIGLFLAQQIEVEQPSVNIKKVIEVTNHGRGSGT